MEPIHTEIELKDLVLNTGQIEGLPANPRKIDVNAFSTLKENITNNPEMLALRGLIVYETKGGKYVVIGGNMRLRAMRELGTFDKAPCIIIPPGTPVEKLKTYTVLDNQQAGDWDWAMVDNDWGVDFFTDLGVELSEEDLPAKEPTEEDLKEDDFDPDLQEEEEIYIKTGDIYRLGRHRLICGDSTDPDTYTRLLLGREVVDLLLTDPPYNVDYGAKWERLRERIAGGWINPNKVNATRRDDGIHNDAMSPEDFRAFLGNFTKCAIDTLKPGGAFYIFHSMPECRAFEDAIEGAGQRVRQHLTWVKNNMVLGTQDYQQQTESIMYGWREGAAHYFTARRDLKTVFDDLKEVEEKGGYEKLKKEELLSLLRKIYDLPSTAIREQVVQSCDLHPTMKPVKLMGRLILYSSREGEIVLDPFGGSGTTLIAAEQTGRACRMIELSPTYCQTIIKRWEEATGEQAVKVSTDGDGIK